MSFESFHEIKIDSKLFASAHPLVTSGVKIGIGLFNRDSEVVGPNNKRVKVPEWTLILHSTSYQAPARTVHGIYKAWDPNADAKSIRNGDNWVWTLRDPQQPEYQPDLCDPIGVIHITDISWSHILLQAVIERSFKAEKNGDNPGGVTVWSSSAWTIRVLYYIQERYGDCTGFRLPCSARRLHELVRERIEVLKVTKYRRGEIPVINLVDPEPCYQRRFKNTRATHM
ncbi:hypothetical protein CVT25_003155 [Psilocybe cyanescens]|uniref:Uncharacterized protein n=1 Tax=Psilocybe cyanescens TaxID=93625 RepID=A0A409X5U2_PSICY|nr:hypothetical protein CVT25_003155 [Psilocybe cyanescens]